MKHLILFSSIALASGLLFVNVYTSLVDARSWSSNVPYSIAAAREYFKTVNPGDFFRMFSPVNQILALLALILFWKSSPSIRVCLGAALFLYVLGDVFTFTYFYPRNDIMFKAARLTDTALLEKSVSEWSRMNWIRSLLILVGLVLSFRSLHQLYMINFPKMQQAHI